MTDLATSTKFADKQREVARRLAALSERAAPHPYTKSVNPDVGR